ncbi:uncharacterized protein LOC135336194 isoform X2 [Halichondria panicea]
MATPKQPAPGHHTKMGTDSEQTKQQEKDPTQRHLTIHVNVNTDFESSFELDLKDPLSADGLAQETSTTRQGNLFVIRFPNVGSSGQFAYVDTYNNVLRYGSDDDKLGLSAVLSITNKTPGSVTKDTQYHLSTIVNPFSFLTPGGSVEKYTQMTYRNFFNGDGTDPTTRFKITNEDGGKETCLSFSALTADHKPVTNGYLMPASVSDGPKQVERPLVVGSAGPNYNTEVYLVGNYTYDTLPVDRSN